jgi:hypothetical protein
MSRMKAIGYGVSATDRNRQRGSIELHKSAERAVVVKEGGQVTPRHRAFCSGERMARQRMCREDSHSSQNLPTNGTTL